MEQGDVETGSSEFGWSLDSVATRPCEAGPPTQLTAPRLPVSLFHPLGGRRGEAAPWTLRAHNATGPGVFLPLSTPQAPMLLLAAAAPQAITVDVDATFLVQLVLFIGLTLILKPILFDPMLKLFEEREKRIDGAKLQARKIDEKSASALAKYDGEMAKARAAASSERDKIRAGAVKREQEILATVRASTQKVLDDGKRAVHEEANRARTALRNDAANMARDVASRVLGREVQS